MIINHNLSSINANRVLHFKGAEVTQNMEKLASGMRINKAGDDASGLAVSEKMRAQIGGLRRAEANAADAKSFIQTAEGYLGETTSVLQRVRELGVQAANGIYTNEDRMQIQVEISQLVDEVDRIASHAQFNGMNMLTGRFARAGGTNAPSASMWFHIGANMDQRIQAFIGTMTSAGLGITRGAERTISVSSPDGANSTIGIVDEALKKVNKQRADMGAYQNRLDHVEKGVAVAWQNLQSAESLIRDANMASEASELVKNQILTQSGASMLAQANMKSQVVLKLLG